MNGRHLYSYNKSKKKTKRLSPYLETEVWDRDELVNLKSGDHFDDNNIMYAQAKTVSIKSKERDVTVTLDGEPIGILPADFYVFHNALNVIA